MLSVLLANPWLRPAGACLRVEALSSAKLYTLDGIVLTRRDHGEADRVVTLLTMQGRCDLLAKGVRKPRSRKAGHLELFSRTRVLAAHVTHSWDILSQAEVQHVRPQLHMDFRRATYARYVAELALRFFEDEAGGALYTLVDDVLTHLEAVEDAACLMRWYEQQVLTLAGFRPVWDACVADREQAQCLRPLHPHADDVRPYGLDLERGGAVCADCLAQAQNVPGGNQAPYLLSPSALSWLQSLQRRSYEDVVQFPFPARTAQELARVMEQYISYHLERRPRALRILRQTGT